MYHMKKFLIWIKKSINTLVGQDRVEVEDKEIEKINNKFKQQL